MSRVLAIEPLTVTAFRALGDVVTMEGAEQRIINQGTATRFHNLANIDVGAEDGEPMLSIFRAGAFGRSRSPCWSATPWEVRPLSR